MNEYLQCERTVGALVKERDELLVARERLQEALENDPTKWSFWTLVTIARLILERDYPADIFTGSSGDPGPVFVARLRDGLAALPDPPLGGSDA